MLKEITRVRQVKGELRRRWFTSSTMDLVVWFDNAGLPVGLQYCYDKGGAERALTWNLDSGFSHMAVDDGEGDAGMQYKATPILMADGNFDAVRNVDLFLKNSKHLPAEILDFVSEKIKEYRPEMNDARST
jgi:hypothetical protein